MAAIVRQDQVRILKALAFHIHKKMPAQDALNTCFEEEGRGGRHRQWRQPVTVLQEQGFVPALLAAELVGPEAACVLAVVERAGDHRLLAAALTALAERDGDD